MKSDRTAPKRRGNELLALAALLGASAFVAVAGGLVTATSVGDWYAGLAKPTFSPPNWLFGPVWTTLYVMMAVAAWRVWKKAGVDKELALYGGQLILNLIWSFLFFGLKLPGLALLEILLLWLAIAATALVFLERDRIAAALMLPYWAWVSFAAVLNGAIWALNR